MTEARPMRVRALIVAGALAIIGSRVGDTTRLVLVGNARPIPWAIVGLVALGAPLAAGVIATLAMLQPNW
jgi:hypothetical protein